MALQLKQSLTLSQQLIMLVSIIEIKEYLSTLHLLFKKNVEKIDKIYYFVREIIPF